ncbi:hypothetical protein ACFWP7_11740 [Streptomyces sp. NPDC058470]|uniref:hypothetical protein n=1 Tax=Streptomyces sp. NPDC058470 TaxID=3346515 RepID=UPI003652A0FB
MTVDQLGRLTVPQRTVAQREQRDHGTHLRVGGFKSMPPAAVLAIVAAVLIGLRAAAL